MSVDKRVNYNVQGGVKNYLGKQKEVKAPLKWQSSPDHPTTELAYITEAEKDLLVKSDLHGSLKGGVNRGPSGIMSLNGWGSADEGQNVSGAAASAAESGQNTSDTLAAGMSNQDVKDFQSAAINAGAGQRVNPGFFDSKYTVSPDVLAEAKKYRQDPNNLFANQAFKKTQGGTLGNFISGGGILGAGIRGLGQMFGLGKKYNEPTYDMSGYNSLGLGGTGQEGFGVPNFESGDGDYDMLGNKINEITGEIISPTGQSLGFLDGYPGQKEGIETIVPVTGGSDEYVRLVEQFLPQSTMPEDEDLLGGFKSRFLQNRTQEEKEAIEKMINEKFKYDYNSFGLGDMDGS
jgi:hypothetical protein